MAGNAMALEILRREAPGVYNALTHLVMALAKANRDTGKRTWFGRDRGVKAQIALGQKIRELIVAMYIHGSASPSMGSGELLDRIVGNVRLFAMAHPNWRDAYDFADYMFIDRREDMIATLDRIRD